MEDFDYGYGALYEAGIRKDEVEEIVHEWSDSPEGWGSEDVMMVLRMKDGRWCYVEAWCDTTGWDCRAGGEAYFASSEEELVRTKLTQIARRTLGYEETPSES